MRRRSEQVTQIFRMFFSPKNFEKGFDHIDQQLLHIENVDQMMNFGDEIEIRFPLYRFSSTFWNIFGGLSLNFIIGRER